MPLCGLCELLVPAKQDNYAVGAFEFWSLDSAQAIVNGAQGMNSPVILQAGPLECNYAGDPEYLVKIAEMAAQTVRIPVGLHLDHAENFDLVERCIQAGFRSVMIDGSCLPLEENIRLTREVVKAAHLKDVSVEGELGILSGDETGSGDNPEAVQTDPEDALYFVKETGVDALAVAIGTAHGFYNYPPKLNIQRLKEITEKTDVPLVLHGGSGVSDNEISTAISNGISKVNICTELLYAFGTGYVETQKKDGFKYSVPNLFSHSKERGQKLVESKIRLFSKAMERTA
jgi:fructose-bisphosphate aldolase class II